MELNKKLMRSAYFLGGIYPEEIPPPVMMEETIKTHHSLRKHLKHLEDVNINDDQIVLFFMGSTDANGNSWCTDCNIVDDLISYVIKMIKPRGHLIRVHVGDRNEWQKKDNHFRTDPKLHVRQVPTVWVWNTMKRASGKKLKDLETITILLED